MVRYVTCDIGIWYRAKPKRTICAVGARRTAWSASQHLSQRSKRDEECQTMVMLLGQLRNIGTPRHNDAPCELPTWSQTILASYQQPRSNSRDCRKQQERISG